MYLEKMNEPEDIQQNITPTTEDDPIAITGINHTKVNKNQNGKSYNT